MRSLGSFLRDVWRLTRPYFRSEEKWSAWGLLLSVLALTLFMVALNVVSSFWSRALYNALEVKDWRAFVELMLFWYPQPKGGGFLGGLPGFAIIAPVFIIVQVYRTYLTQWLQIRWRRWMTRQFVDEWLTEHSYYRITLAADPEGVATDNPDQRISEDIRSFVNDTLSLGFDLISNIVNLLSFLGILWAISGPLTLLGITIPGYMVWVALLYAIVGTWLTHLVGRPLALLNFQQQRYEADFRFALVRLRENAEGVALYGGEAQEKAGLAGRFVGVVTNWWGIMRRTKLLNGLTFGYGQVSNVFPFVVAAPRYFSGAIALGVLTQTADAFGQVQGAMSWFINSYASLATWRSEVERLATFQRAVHAAAALGSTGAVMGTASDGGFALEDLTLTLPGGAKLLDHASLAIRPGESTVITGRSGSGKSTLFRLIAGIWPFAAGRVQRPAGRILFLPQRPYFPIGTLREAVCYPEAPGGFTDAAVGEALTGAGLGGLAAGLDEHANWSHRLSGGEQQRLAMARALLLKPDWLFLDEATANLDPEAERALHAVLHKTLPATTIVSIAHSAGAVGMHDREITFERQEGSAGRLIPAAEPVK